MKLSSLDANIRPMSSSRTYRFFPGWTMVGMAAAAQYMSAPGQSYSVAAFKEPMRTSLNISEVDYSLAYAFATIISGCLLPLVGRLVDRAGARRTLPAIALLLGLACFGMSRVNGLASLYIGFSLVRSIGQGALSLIAAWLVGEWFTRRRGVATAISGFGGSISMMTIPLINAYCIKQFDWQTGWIVLGVAVWTTLFFPSLLFIRDRPEELGLLPDGDPPSEIVPHSDDEVTSTNEPQAADWSVAHVVRDPTFWKLLAVPATSGLVGTGLVFHTVSLLGSRGVPATWAMWLLAFQALMSTCVALVAGWLTDRYPARFLLSFAMLMLAIAGIVVLRMPVPIIAVVYAIILGLHGSVLRSTGMVVWMNYYGREHQGAIRGIALAVMVFAAAAGPLPLAISVDYYETYDFALYFFIAIPLISSVLVWTAGPPQHRPKTTHKSDGERPFSGRHRR